VAGTPWPQRLALAAALGTATVAAPVAGEYAQSDYEAALTNVRITRLEPAA